MPNPEFDDIDLEPERCPHGIILAAVPGCPSCELRSLRTDNERLRQQLDQTVRENERHSNLFVEHKHRAEFLASELAAAKRERGGLTFEDHNCLATIAAHRMSDEIHRLVIAGKIGSRSRLADAALDWKDPDFKRMDELAAAREALDKADDLCDWIKTFLEANAIESNETPRLVGAYQTARAAAKGGEVRGGE